MKEQREKRKRWVRRGKYAVEVEVEVVYPAGDPSEPCLEPATVRWLDEIASGRDSIAERPEGQPPLRCSCDRAVAEPVSARCQP